MTIDIKFCELSLSDVKNAMIIPDGYFKNKEDSAYTSTALSFYKELKKAIPVVFLTPPTALIEQRSIEWFGPFLYLTANIVQNHPDIIDVVLNAVKACAGRMSEDNEPPLISFDIIYEESEGVKKTHVSYKGDSEGLEKLKPVLRGLFNGK